MAVTNVPEVAAVVNFVLEQGVTFDYTITVSTGGTIAEGGTAVDLTDVSDVRMHVRALVGDNDTLIELTTANGRASVVAPATDGKIRLVAPATATADVEKDGVYDLEVEFNDGTVKRYFRGDVTLRRGVTR